MPGKFPTIQQLWIWQTFLLYVMYIFSSKMIPYQYTLEFNINLAPRSWDIELQSTC